MSPHENSLIYLEQSCQSCMIPMTSTHVSCRSESSFIFLVIYFFNIFSRKNKSRYAIEKTLKITSHNEFYLWTYKMVCIDCWTLIVGVILTLFPMNIGLFRIWRKSLSLKIFNNNILRLQSHNRFHNFQSRDLSIEGLKDS